VRLSMIVTPFSDENLQLAAQVGVEEIVAVYPGSGLETLLEMKRRVEAQGMRLTHIERKLPHDQIVHGLAGSEEQTNAIVRLIRDMGEAGLEVLCYNWMPNEDWCRTTCENPERGGSLTTAFDVDAPRGTTVTDAAGAPANSTPASELWDNLERFLHTVIPVAESVGIKLALHPDDPPLAKLWGQEQIITSIDALERVTQLVPSPNNGVCFCTGSLGPAGEDLVAGVKRLGDRIHFVHLRNTRGTAERFQETWHDNGDLDLPAIVRGLRELGYAGTIRPDHAPSMLGEPNLTPGYEMQGRIFAAGYLRGLIQSA
jgi:mannonate dehydratase